MKVSVILPTLNAEVYITGLIQSLNNQSVPPHEIIVIDSSSEDGTVRIARENGAHVLLVERHEFDHGGTRNYAAKAAVGDILVFMTQDALPQHNKFLESITEPFGDLEVAAVCGRQVARPDANVLEKMTRELNYPDELMRKSLADLERYGIKLFFFTNVCSAIRKETFERVGGFPEPIILNEDMMIAAKFIVEGHTIVYNPEASVIHSHDYSLTKQFCRNFDIGVSLRMNDWLLKYARAEREGGKLVKTQLKRLWRNGEWRWIPRWLAEAVAKYSGYRLGLSYQFIPLRIRQKCSLHAGFWQRYEKRKEA